MTVQHEERGSALLPVMLLMFLFAAIAFGATAVVRIEVMVAERFRQSAEAQYAAEAGLEVVLSELRSMPTWAPVVSGSVRSVSADGVVTGLKAVPGGGTVAICCGSGSAADRLAIETRSSALPARRALDWKPYLWMPFDRLVPGDQPSRLYIAVWVARHDVAAEEGSDEAEAVLVRSDAVDPGGRRRTIEALAQRRSPDALHVMGWREVR